MVVNKPVIAENVLVGMFRLIVPVLLGAILTYAIGISSTQGKQSNDLAEMHGQLGAILQQNTDYSGRLAKVERGTDESRAFIATLMSRMAVLESENANRNGGK